MSMTASGHKAALLQCGQSINLTASDSGPQKYELRQSMTPVRRIPLTDHSLSIREKTRSQRHGFAVLEVFEHVWSPVLTNL